MRYLGFSFLLFFASYSSAFAQALVRSGEHDAFSRLVIYVPDSQDWELARSEEGFRLTLNNWNSGFDTSSIFERMPQTRVAGVETTESELALLLNCNCIANAERVQGVGIIVDVSEDTSAAPETDTSLSSTINVEAVAPPLPEIFADIRTAPTLDLTPLPEEDPINPALDAFRKSLFEGLGRSASLSLVDIAEAENPTDAEDMAEGGAKDFGETLDDGRVRVTTALESAQNRNGSRIALTEKTQCPPAREFAISDWGEDAEFGKQLAELRRGLLGEFDSVSPKRVQELARLYLYFGLGSEARLLVKQFNIPEFQKNIVLGLADILEPELFGPKREPLDISGCGAQTVPWSVLAKTDGDFVTEKEAVETIAQFSIWPRHLQELLGPKLISILSSSDRIDSVEVLKNILSRQGGELSQAAELAAEKYREPSSESLAALLEIAQSGSDQSPAALALYLEKSLQEKSPFNEDLIELASAFAEEMKGTELSLELTSLEVEALAAKGRVLDSIDVYRRAKAAGWAADKSLGDKLASHILDTGNREAVAQLSVFLAGLEDEFDISKENQNKLSQELLDMGLPVLAGRIYQVRPTPDEPTRIAAELAIASGAVDQAVEILDEFEDQDASQRRAEVLLRSGRALEAWETRSLDTSEEQAARLAWYAQQWNSAAASGAEGQVASLIVNELEADLETEPLASAKELNEKSSSARSAIRELLQSNGF